MVEKFLLKSKAPRVKKFQGLGLEIGENDCLIEAQQSSGKGW
jgi:hypothetical protein